MYGAERWILALVRHLSRDAVESTVGVIRDDPGSGPAPLCREAAALGLPTVEFEAFGRLSLPAIAAIRRYVSDERINILHTHGYKTDIIGALAGRGGRCRIVSTPHGWSTDAGLKLQLYESLDRLAFHFCDAVVPLSGELFAGLQRFPRLRGKLHLIVNGVDLSEVDAAMAASAGARDSGDGVFRVGYIGQLIARKRLDTLIRAFHALRIENRELWLIGEGEQRVELELLVQELGESGNVRFFGYREDRLQLLAGFDVFVLPSSLEGIPRCLMESMAARVPVVATDIPGCNDLVTSGETGVLFPLGDAAELARILCTLFEDPALRRRLSDNGRRLVETGYSAALMAERYTTLYRQLCGSGALAAAESAR